MREPWRYRCPEGHTSITRCGDHYRCQSCERQYSGEPVDMLSDTAHGVNDERGVSEPRVDARGVTEMVYQRTDDVTTTVHAKDLPVPTQAAVNALLDAAEQGYVDRYERSRRSAWFVTDRGEQLVARSEPAEVAP